MNEVAGRDTTTSDAIAENSIRDSPAVLPQVAQTPAPGALHENDSRESDSPHNTPTVVIQPTQGWLDLNLSEVWRYRELLMALAMRDIKLRYRQTAMGASWVVLQPLLSAGIFTIVFGKIARLETGGVPPFLFYYAAMLGWNTFSATLSKASSCIVGNSGLIAKIYFPRLILPFSVIFSTLLDFAVAFAVMIVLLLAYHVPLTWGILLLPVWLVLLCFCAMGIGLIASALMVTYRDVTHILPVATSLLMYGSAVVFSLDEALRRTNPQFHIFFYANPLVSLIEAFRWSLLGSGTMLLLPLIWAAVFSFGIFFAGMIAFHSKERLFADAI